MFEPPEHPAIAVALGAAALHQIRREPDAYGGESYTRRRSGFNLVHKKRMTPC